MKRSPLFNQTSFFIVSLLFMAVVASAYIPANYAPFGGPRNVIQERSAIEVTQFTADLLHVVVVDEDGAVVHNLTTLKESISISTENWEPGEYVIQTMSSNADYQEDIIVVE